jgi:hypothetical protein
MYACPLCNGFQTIDVSCESCNHNMSDQGRLVDYYDDYSPYMEEENAKMVDGIPNSKEDHLCLHLFKCPHCASDSHVIIKEVKPY